MILEAIVSSVNIDGQVNFAPMGVHTLAGNPDEPVSMRLYFGSQTYANLQSTGQGVICFCDDVSLFVETALYSACLPHVPSEVVAPPRLTAAERVWEFTVNDFVAAIDPAAVAVQVVRRWERGGGFHGFCRARMAVLEATIAATRLRLAPDKISGSWHDWLALVVKTGGAREWAAMNRVYAYLAAEGLALPSPPGVVAREGEEDQVEKNFASAGSRS